MDGNFSEGSFSLNPEQILSVSPATFEQTALQLFQYQYHNNAVYRAYANALSTASVSRLEEIPFLPIELFKSQKVYCGEADPEMIFTSSGTTGMVQSRHLVRDLSFYDISFQKAFRQFYGNPEELAILALLPSYQEREGSSLIYMVDALVEQSGIPESGYFLHQDQLLSETLLSLKQQGRRTLLIGVTYALLDFIEHYPMEFPELMVMETGGMKGRRKEMIREELHQLLCGGFGVRQIHSEYGMTELLSQAYSKGEGLFECPCWMQVIIRDANDPFSLLEAGRSGGINVIDLANLHSCSFIATQDLGRINSEGLFEVLGRFDQSDIRGCNLLVQ